MSKVTKKDEKHAVWIAVGLSNALIFGNLLVGNLSVMTVLFSGLIAAAVGLLYLMAIASADGRNCL